MKQIILYRSVYGSSEKYATWLADELQCKAKTKLTPSELQEFELIIYIGGLYAGGISGFRRFKRHLPTLQNKKIVLCMVGLSSPTLEHQYEEVFAKNVPAEYQDQIKYFALKGDLLSSKLSLLHRLMMLVPKKMTEKIPVEQRSEENRLFLATYGNDVVFSQKENITPVLEYIKDLSIDR